MTAHFDSPAFFEVEGKLGTRSTSVGDVIVLSDGQVLECAAFGWDPIEAKAPRRGVEADVLPDDPNLWRGDTTNGPKGGEV